MCDKVVFGVLLSGILVAGGCTRENPLFHLTDDNADLALGTSAGPDPISGLDAGLTESADLAGLWQVVDLGNGPHPDLAPIACAPGTVDCDGIAANGCETIASHDPGEPTNSTCDGASSMTKILEGSTGAASGRILVPGDLDVFTVELDEALHACSDASMLDYTVRATLTAPTGVPLSLRGALDRSACSTNWSAWATQNVCFHFSDACTAHASQLVSLQVGSPAGASSCLPYTLQVHFCAAGDPCGC
jgi:hypothetical protein